MIISVQEAISLLKEGKLVAIPTETVYGLAADAFNFKTIERIFFAKGRPADNPLIVHISSLEQLNLLTDSITDAHLALAKHFWPGPLTMLFKKKASVLDKITAGLDTVAIRMPNHPIALEIIKETGPLVAPSANKSGKPSTTRVEHVLADYSGLIPVVDGGKCEIGIESTVLDCTSEPFQILRPGAIGVIELKTVVPNSVFQTDSYNSQQTEKPKSPGMKYTHYSPNAKVRWMNPDELEGEYDESVRYLHLHGEYNSLEHKGFHTNLTLLSKDLYDQFRYADELGVQEIAIEPFSIDTDTLSIALFNRIQKAIGVKAD